MAKTTSQERVKRLEAHLKQENPVLAGVVQSFRQLDRVAGRLGLIDDEESYAARVSWWPVISVLGTFSAGKSTFLNQYSGAELQRTGNQAVDDKFTVICYGSEETPASLPGLALDADPRFPFYQISELIQGASEGDGRGVDSYLQLKTCKSEALRGKIFIDSPGFDADQQRTSTLVITDHIIDLSDLVLVFFDARHPEPGAMGDTLKHLVANTVHRPDASKFLYILNQIDNTAREDNPEEVVAAWQRAMAQYGLTAGRFYRIYSDSAALPIEDEQVRARLERKRDEDLADIESRIQQVEVERAYRVVGMMEKTALHLRDVLVPRLADARRAWRRRTLILSGLVFGGGALLFVGLTVSSGQWQGLRWTPLAALDQVTQIILAVAGVLLAGYLYTTLRRVAGRSVLRALEKDEGLGEDRAAIVRAFASNLSAWWRSLASPRPRGWSRRTRRLLDGVLGASDKFVQSLNDRHASPSGAQAGKKKR
ncbi:MAG: dynamin family protein [Pseudomonadales bacterium]